MSSGKKKGLELRLVSADDPSFRRLSGELEDAFFARYGEAVRQQQAQDDISTACAACVLMKDGEAVACGAIRHLDASTAELKRVYVRPEQRKHGYGRMVVEAMELQALWQGYTRMVMTTGRKNKEGMALYRRLGYRLTEPWGIYIGDKASLCMEKELE